MRRRKFGVVAVCRVPRTVVAAREGGPIVPAQRVGKLVRFDEVDHRIELRASAAILHRVDESLDRRKAGGAMILAENLRCAPGAGLVRRLPIERGGIIEPLVLVCAPLAVEGAVPPGRAERDTVAIARGGVLAAGQPVEDMRLIENFRPAVLEEAVAAGLNLDDRAYRGDIALERRGGAGKVGVSQFGGHGRLSIRWSARTHRRRSRRSLWRHPAGRLRRVRIFAM
jgi:hypothetical protein